MLCVKVDHIEKNDREILFCYRSVLRFSKCCTTKNNTKVVCSQDTKEFEYLAPTH